ncbi:hypothetical protein [Rickettsia asembonensis]|uniref:Uncharacterized protein n=1 Tax=Rickettsia asembonensis TaxID=1068590 RepID=A0A0C2R8V9_9RICK|nr:hypothetical protein [Rickettsia asembonensis]KIJ88643.1 hypothetical protein SB78_04475 [Rickettsia asembonensis]WCR56754.1 MAG: hypothetical protein PG979_000811 [Rickettsia asembonensis]
MLLDKLVLGISIEVIAALVKIKTYCFFPKKEKVTLTKYNSTENIEALKVNTDEAKTVKITKEDLEKSFELYEEKLTILAQKLSSQTSISYDDYNPVTEYYYVEALGKETPVTEL